MRPQALVRWMRSAWEVAGPAAPLVAARHLRLTALNRTSKGRVIRAVPQVCAAPHVARVEGDVVVPVYNNFEDTRLLIGALENDGSIPGRIILVHDCSTDARVGPLLAAYAARDPRVELIENGKNSGFVHTCNRGILASQRDVVILNTDIVLPKGAVARILAHLQSGPAIASVTPLSNSAYGVGLPDLLYANELPFGATVEEIDGVLQSLPPLAPIELPTGVGFCMGMSRSVIEQIGPFDEDFGLGYGEETDFCMRAAARGFAHILASNCYVGHKGGASFGSSWQDRSRKGLLKVIYRHPVFVDRVTAYLDRCETRALGFAALARLMTYRSGAPLDVKRDAAANALGDALKPVLAVETQGDLSIVTLAWQRERYSYRFESEEQLNAAIALACAA